MAKFIGREREMNLLESSYGESCAFLIYGRRRIGKTTLIKRFCRDKRALFFSCLDSSVRDNLRYFTDVVSDFRGERREEYRDYYEFFNDLAAIGKDELTVVVLDEFQYISTESPEVKSYAQHLIDKMDRDETRLMLILCGSSVRTMRSLAEDGANPLYGRFKRKIVLGPLSFEETRLLHPGMGDLDCLKLYLTVGGIPRYHVEIDQTTYDDCIRDNFLSDGWMTEEAEDLIRSEFSPSERYMSVISAISGGAVILKEIAEKVGVKESTCKYYLDELLKSGIISTVNPMMGAPKRKTYYVADYLFAFNYEVLTRRRYMISTEDAESSLREIGPYISTFLGRRFELFCKDFIVRNYTVKDIGRWWIDNSRTDTHEDIDIVARVSSSGVSTDLFIECKFTKDPSGFTVFNRLDNRVQGRFDKGNYRLGIISVSGFEEELRDFASQAHILLIGPEELFGYTAPCKIENL